MTEGVDTTTFEAAARREIERRLAAPSAPRPGERVGPYRLVKLLGAGAVGSVFEVEHEKLGRRAALKLLAPELGRRPAARARFFEEALAVNSIHSRHIVEVTDVVDTEERQALVMELLDGETLGAAMAAGPLPPERFLPLLAEVCAGLAAAHAAGFVHRDLKPDNVFLCARGEGELVKLLDFGLATTFGARASSDERPSGVRRHKTFVGTPDYVSPEQAAGDSVDHTTDLYAVGVMLFELVTGRVPFRGASLEQYLMAHTRAPVPRLPAALVETELGRTLDVIVQRCMAKDPASRFASAAELATTFAALGRGELPVVSSVTILRQRRPRFPRLAVGAVAVALAAGLAGMVVTQRERPPAAAAALAAPRAAAGPASLVTVLFESEPPGAEVRLVTTGELLGVTPFRRTFEPRVPAPVVEIERAGFVVARASLPTSEGGTVRAVLERNPKARAPSRAHRRLDVEKTFDPFVFRR